MVAAVVFLALDLVVVVFQLALAAGMPWGDLAWGGKFAGKLPGSMRVVAFVSAVFLVAFGLIVAIRAGFLLPDWQPISRTLIWLVVAYCVLGTLANAATPSRWERIVWLPVVLGMLISSLIVGISSHGQSDRSAPSLMSGVPDASRGVPCVLEAQAAWAHQLSGGNGGDGIARAIKIQNRGAADWTEGEVTIRGPWVQATKEQARGPHRLRLGTVVKSGLRVNAIATRK